MATELDQRELTESRRAFKLGLRFASLLAILYVVFWAALAIYFSYAAHFKGSLERMLSQAFEREVTIAQVQTTWRRFMPRFEIQGFEVQGDIDGQPALAFDSLSAEIDTLSLLRFWPEFTEFAVKQPMIEIVSLGSKKLLIAGIPIESNSGQGVTPKRFISWLSDQKNIAWVDGNINWRRIDGSTQHYRDMSFVYVKEAEQRSVNAVLTTPKGELAFDAEANGDLFSESDWDASLRVLGNQGQPLLAPGEMSFEVENGQGKLSLKTLNIERIRDFIRLSGLVDKAGWLLDSELSGRLHDVLFEFSGPLFNIVDWSLIASASDIGFKSIGSAPSMNNLAGSLKASSSGGRFLFSTKDSLFQWARWFDSSIPIDLAKGVFSWRVKEQGGVAFDLTNGHFEDKNAKIYNLNAHIEIDKKSHGVANMDELFKLVSIGDLRFGNIEQHEQNETSPSPLLLDASADFEIMKMEAVDTYLPNDKRIKLLKQWWESAFLSGRTNHGRISYVGELSKQAIYNGKASFQASTEFEGVEIDYGYQQGWPKVKQASGKATIQNDLFTIHPDEVWLEDDKVTRSHLQINSLFRRERELVLDAELTTSLPKVVDFLFNGPLIPPANKRQQLPVTSDQGTVTSQVLVTIPLQRVRAAKVQGTAQVSDGRVYLPPGVPVEKLVADIKYTEKSVRSNNIRAQFLGGATQATLVTTELAQPPKVKLQASGTLQSESLQPWVGEHLLTWVNGQTPWQGTVSIGDGMVNVVGESSLEGLHITAPEPLTKQAEALGKLDLSLTINGKNAEQKLSVSYNDVLQARLQSNKKITSDEVPTLLDNALIKVGTHAFNQQQLELKEGIHFDIQYDQLDLDDCIESLITLAQYQPKSPANSTKFLDMMRSINIQSDDPFLLDRKFGPLQLTGLSVDGKQWIGSIKGENVDGTLRAQPRDTPGNYAFDFKRLTLTNSPKEQDPIPAIDYSLNPADYPTFSLNVDKLWIEGKNLGRLELLGQSNSNAWELSKFDLSHNGIRTTADGRWVNDPESGSVSSFNYKILIDEAEGALDDMDFDGFIKKGKGHMDGNFNWIGAPHEFDYSRLSGDFYLRISDGELVKVAPGTGKLLGLLNFNAIGRRLTLDFSDVFASGLQFDRMVYNGILANGEAIMREAYVLTPAVFVRLEGKLDLGKELIDMEIHMAPELGGNLTLLSALANPAAGAVVFLTQRLFKEEMRKSSFRSYRALGTWEDFELVELDGSNSEEDIKASSETLQEPKNDASD